jgi:hypothetical protein
LGKDAVSVGWGETTPFKVFFLAFLQAHVRLQYDGFVWRFFLLAVASSGLVFSENLTLSILIRTISQFAVISLPLGRSKFHRELFV